MKEAFGARTYLVGQILAGLAGNEKATWEQIADDAILLADLTIHKMGQQIVHPWEKTDATVPGTTSDQNEATL